MTNTLPSEAPARNSHHDVLLYRAADRAFRVGGRILPPSELVERAALWWGVRYRPDPAVVRLRSGPVIGIDPSDYLQTLVYYTGTFEPHEIKLLTRCLAPGDTFVDAGANIGVHTLVAARAVGPAGRVVSIEASPDNATLLRANIARNHFDHVTVIEGAIGDRAGTVTLRRPANGNRGMFTLGDVGGDAVCDVPMLRLDDMLDAANVGRVAVVKIDIEGCEYVSLLGAPRLLHEQRPVFLLELNEAALQGCGASCQQVKQLFREAGYDGWIAGRRKLTPIDWDAAHDCDECLFIHKDRRDQRRKLNLP
jgi:FkbM family methyltransferase